MYKRQVLGSVLFIGLEFVIENAIALINHDWAKYWHLPFGAFLIAVVLFVPGGVIGLFKSKERKK